LKKYFSTIKSKQTINNIFINFHYDDFVIKYKNWITIYGEDDDMAAIKLYFGLIFLGITAFLSSFICNQTPVDSASVATEPVFTLEQSTEIAEAFIKKGGTYFFDGIDGTLKLKDTDTLRCPSCWKFVYEFQSAHAGYGNRGGMVVAEVVTPHKAEITVVRGEVTRATLDGWWDMITQEQL
jgi:hypothetical protein